MTVENFKSVIRSMMTSARAYVLVLPVETSCANLWFVLLDWSRKVRISTTTYLLVGKSSVKLQSNDLCTHFSRISSQWPFVRRTTVSELKQWLLRIGRLRFNRTSGGWRTVGRSTEQWNRSYRRGKRRCHVQFAISSNYSHDHSSSIPRHYGG